MFPAPRPHSAEFATHKIRGGGEGGLGKSDLNILKIHLLPHRKDNVSITKTSRSIPVTTVNSVYTDHINTERGENVKPDP